MAASAECDRVLAQVDDHWRGAGTLGRLSGAAPAAVRRCLEEALARGEVATPRGVYAGVLWRRPPAPARDG